MTHYRMIGAAVIALSVSTGAAFAADVGGPQIYVPPPTIPGPPVVVETYNWSGPYVGATVGYGWGEAEDTNSNSVELDGFNAGGFAGYQADMGGLVVGAEVDALWSNIEGTLGPATAEIGTNGSVRARVGADLGRALVYGTGGLAIGQGHVVAPGIDETNTHYGWTAGAGVDLAVTDNVFGRVEYRYTDFGAEAYGLAGDVDLQSSTVSAGLGLRF